jgi:hypothetical protein
MAAANCHAGRLDRVAVYGSRERTLSQAACLKRHISSGLADSERFMARNRVVLVGSAIAFFAIAAAAPRSAAEELNDYPTSARAEYVFGCMKANGETPRALEQCSCSIDTIASLLPYERYVSAETVLRMSQVPGILGSQFRSTEKARTALDDLRRAQAEAEVRCF